MGGGGNSSTALLKSPDPQVLAPIYMDHAHDLNIDPRGSGTPGRISRRSSLNFCHFGDLMAVFPFLHYSTKVFWTPFTGIMFEMDCPL